MPPIRKKGNDIQKIKALEPCKHDGALQFTDVPQRLRQIKAMDNESCSCKTHTLLYGTISNGLAVQFPIGLSFGAAASGRPDLRIELVRLRWGNTEGACVGHRSPDHQAHLEHLRTNPWVSSPRFRSTTHSNQLVCARDNRRGTRAATDGREAQPSITAAAAAAGVAVHCTCAHQHSLGGGGGANSIGRYASTAGALLLFSVLQRDAVATVGPSLVLPGLAVLAAELTSAAVKAVAAAVPPPAADPDPDLDPRSYSHRLTVPVAGREEEPIPLPPAGRNWRRRLGGIKAGVGHVSRAAAASLERILGASALLSLAARTWRTVHASSAALAEAVADLTAVGLSYSCLARHAQLGRLPPGRTREMAWRKLHKAAAQRLAHHLGDLPEQPPLGPALAALQRCSIAAGLAVDGVPLCGALDALAAYGGGCTAATAAAVGSGPTSWECGGGDGGGGGRRSRQLLLSFSYSDRRRRHPRRRHAAAAAAARADSTNEHFATTATSQGATVDGGGCGISTAAGGARSGVGDCVVPVTATGDATQLTPEIRSSIQSAATAASAAAATLNDPWDTCSRPTHRCALGSACSETTPAEKRDQNLPPPKPLPASPVSSAASQSPPASTAAASTTRTGSGVARSTTPAASGLSAEVRHQTAPGRLFRVTGATTPSSPASPAHAPAGNAARAAIPATSSHDGAASPLSIPAASQRSSPPPASSTCHLRAFSALTSVVASPAPTHLPPAAAAAAAATD
ncbi:hypothetical protein Vretifemale_5517, partial [Volvox reticuliferus]